MRLIFRCDGQQGHGGTCTGKLITIHLSCSMIGRGNFDKTFATNAHLSSSNAQKSIPVNFEAEANLREAGFRGRHRSLTPQLTRLALRV